MATAPGTHTKPRSYLSLFLRSLSHLVYLQRRKEKESVGGKPQNGEKRMLCVCVCVTRLRLFLHPIEPYVTRRDYFSIRTHSQSGIYLAYGSCTFSFSLLL